MESLPPYIKDTTDFIFETRQLPPLSEDRFLVTLDVESSYSKIPHNEGIKAYQYFMRNGCKPEGSIQSISKLIELVLTKNRFPFNNTNYIQKLDTAMGTHDPAYASLFMETFENDFLESSDVQPFCCSIFCIIFS